MTSQGGPAAAVVKKSRGPSLVWIVPIVAALAAGWLWWRTIQEQGPLITITFVTADGLEAGKTKVKFKNVEVGVVEQLDSTLLYLVAPSSDAGTGTVIKVDDGQGAR